MPKCLTCSTIASCSCSFTNGLCSKCYNNSQKKKAGLSEDTSCSYTLETLRTIQRSLNSKPNKTSLDTYHLAILRSQINQFEENPCRFMNIINNLIL